MRDGQENIWRARTRVWIEAEADLWKFQRCTHWQSPSFKNEFEKAHRHTMTSLNFFPQLRERGRTRIHINRIPHTIVPRDDNDTRTAHPHVPHPAFPRADRRPHAREVDDDAARVEERDGLARKRGKVDEREERVGVFWDFQCAHWEIGVHERQETPRRVINDGHGITGTHRASKGRPNAAATYTAETVEQPWRRPLDRPETEGVASRDADLDPRPLELVQPHAPRGGRFRDVVVEHDVRVARVGIFADVQTRRLGTDGSRRAGAGVLIVKHACHAVRRGGDVQPAMF